MRDPSVSPRVKVTVVNGNANDLLVKSYSNYLRTAQYIDPKVTLYDFTRDYYDDGVDPVAPMIKDDGEHVVMDGIALFQDDRYRMKVAAQESIYLQC